MSTDQIKGLTNPPILESVIDIECDFQPGVRLEDLESQARAAFAANYPHVDREDIFEQQFEVSLGPVSQFPPAKQIPPALNKFRFWSADRRQLVQVQRSGFAFNRLAPYTSLKDYLPEINRCWKLYCTFAKPLSIRSIRLRSVNRLKVLGVGTPINLSTYLRCHPMWPDPQQLHMVGFVHQHAMIDVESGNQVSVILSTQPSPTDLNLILDIAVATSETFTRYGPDLEITDRILELRSLRNRVFKGTVTEECLNQYR